MQKIIFSSLLLFIFPFLVISQDLGAYSDYLDHFFIFDHGKSQKVEDIKIQSFKIGGECIMYINSQGNLKLYRDGVVTKLEPGGITNYFATDHITAYQIFNQLSVVEKDKPVILSYDCPIFQVQDSLITFYDVRSYSLKIYYKGEVFDIESGLLGRPINRLSSGDNIVAYVSSRTNDFKIWYNGNCQTIVNYIDKLTFKAGRDIVAYFNNIDNTFHAFYKGKDFLLENFPVKSYEVADGFVAYVDNTGSFKVFYEGEVITIVSFAPDLYKADDNLMAFTEYGALKVFYMGKVYDLEGYLPSVYKNDWNTLAYLDNSNRIWVFSKGEKKYLSNELIESFNIYRDLIIMGVKINRNIIYYKGEFIDGMSY